MKIDMSKVNLTEKDIEDWLYENPEVLRSTGDNCPLERWIGRQYQLPSGIADLIGIRENRTLVVVEVKNVPINKAAILQVCRYTEDLKYIVGHRIDYPYRDNDWNPHIEMIVVGPSIDDQTFTEAKATGVRIFQFSAQLNLYLSALEWNDEHRRKVREQQELIARGSEWDIYGLTLVEHYSRRHDEQERPDDGTTIIHGVHLGEGYSDIILANGDEADEQLIATDEYDRLMDAIASEEDAPDGDGVELTG